MWHDRKIHKKEFTPGSKVLLFNSRLKLFPGKLKSKWEWPCVVEEAFSSGAVRLRGAKETWIVNGQRLKPYLASEQKMVEVIDTVTIDEYISDTYDKDIGFSDFIERELMHQG